MKICLCMAMLLWTVCVDGKRIIPVFCTDCPLPQTPCDFGVNIRTSVCVCATCVTKCSVRNNRCPAGQQCVEKPLSYNNIPYADGAFCETFSGCPALTYDVTCPISGKFIDLNGCETRLCNDPCAEKVCVGDCYMRSITTYGEPNYYCMGDTTVD